MISFKTLREELTEAKPKYKASDYKASYREALRGYYAMAIHKTNKPSDGKPASLHHKQNITLWSSTPRFKTPKAATAAAEVYLKAYASGGAKAGDKAVKAYVKDNKQDRMESVS